MLLLTSWLPHLPGLCFALALLLSLFVPSLLWSPLTLHPKHSHLPSLFSFFPIQELTEKPVLPLNHLERCCLYFCLCLVSAHLEVSFTLKLIRGGFLPTMGICSMEFSWNSLLFGLWPMCFHLTTAVFCSISPLSPCSWLILCPGPGNAPSKPPLVDCLVGQSVDWSVCLSVCLGLSAFFPPLPPSPSSSFFLSETASLCSPGCRGPPEIPVPGLKVCARFSCSFYHILGCILAVGDSLQVVVISTTTRDFCTWLFLSIV